LNPFFGLNLARYLFEPVNEDVANTILQDVSRGIATYEPRIRVRNINVGYSIDRQEYIINLIISVPSINNTAFNLVGTLSNSGFFLNN